MLPVRGATGKGQEAFRVGHEDFNPCSPCGERRSRTFESVLDPVFQSMLPVRGATTSISELPLILGISIHAPRAGSDLRPPPCCAGRDPNFNPCSPCGERLVQVSYQIVAVFDFNPCSPCGERPDVPGWDGSAQIFQSMLPVRGATSVPVHLLPMPVISIHAPRAGSDRFRTSSMALTPDFNPCSPCGERPSSASAGSCASLFQSMLPVRGATRVRSKHQRQHKNFNPCSPCGERQTGGGHFF